jgi:hypothetical protein
MAWTKDLFAARRTREELRTKLDDAELALGRTTKAILHAEETARDARIAYNEAWRQHKDAEANVSAILIGQT